MIDNDPAKIAGETSTTDDRELTADEVDALGLDPGLRDHADGRPWRTSDPEVKKAAEWIVNTLAPLLTEIGS